MPAKPWEMPAVGVGDTVTIFRDTNDEKGGPAVVCKIGQRSIGCICLLTHTLYHGMRHRTDPELKDRQDLISEAHGVWDVTPTTKRLVGIEDRLAELERAVASLCETVYAVSKRGPKAKVEEGAQV